MLLKSIQCITHFFKLACKVLYIITSEQVGGTLFAGWNMLVFSLIKFFTSCSQVMQAQFKFWVNLQKVAIKKMIVYFIFWTFNPNCTLSSTKTLSFLLLLVKAITAFWFIWLELWPSCQREKLFFHPFVFVWVTRKRNKIKAVLNPIKKKWNVTPLLDHFGGRVGFCGIL